MAQGGGKMTLSKFICAVLSLIYLTQAVKLVSDKQGSQYFCLMMGLVFGAIALDTN